MKKSINIAGIVFLLILFAGIVFKRMHCPGAGIMLTLSLLLFITVYLPAFFRALYRQMSAEGRPAGKLTVIASAAGIIILTFGILAKIMHWPGAGYGLWIGIATTSVAVLVYLLANRRSETNIPLAPVLIITIVLGFFSFNMFRFGNLRPMTVAYNQCGEASKQSAVLLSERCAEILADPANAALSEKLEKISGLANAADGILEGMNTGISRASAEAEDISPKKRDEFFQSSIGRIFSGEKGFSAFETDIKAFKSLVSNSEFCNAGLKEKIYTLLAGQYSDGEPIPGFTFIGVYAFRPEICTGSINIWRNRVREAEYLALSACVQAR